MRTAENTLGSAYSVVVGSTKVMQYDAHGNITRFNQGNTTRSNTYFAGTNRLYYNNWLMYNYDTSGRISSREASLGIETFSYDPYVGKPATVMGQVPVRYGYGGGSQRVLKEVNYTSPSPQKTVYIHGLGDYPLAEYRNHGPDPVTRYVYGPSGLLAIHKGLQGTILFPLKDHLGSSRVVLETKPQGSGRQVKPLAVYDYWPFGADMQTAGGVAGYRYTGQEYEAETDMYNYRARLYSQHMGHFMAPDPAGQFHSPYVAMGNNPVNMVDPDGMTGIEATFMFKAAPYIMKAIFSMYTYAAATTFSGGMASPGGFLMSATQGVLFGPNIATVGQAAVTIFVSVAPMDIQIYQSKNFSMSLSPVFFTGTEGFGAGASLNAQADLGSGFTLSAGTSQLFNSASRDLSSGNLWNNVGYEGRYSGMMTYSEKGWSVSAGATQFTGNYKQRVGRIGGSVGRFSLYHENDFWPVMGDGQDRWRTAALNVSWRLDDDTSINSGFSLLTGAPSEYYKRWEGPDFYDNEDKLIRNGILFGGVTHKGKSYQSGWNHESVRHHIQNRLHRHIGSPQFRVQPYGGQFHRRYGTANSFTIY